MKIFIVMPAYNEEKRIGNLLKSIVKKNYPVIVVDDGSKDNTAKVVKKYKVNLLKHKVNLGKGAALLTGCQAAFKLGAKAVIIMDSDGQHKVDDLVKFIKILNEKKYDVIFGTRRLDKNMPTIRLLGNKFASMFVKILFGVYISDLICGFRAFNKKAFKKISWQSSGYGIETEMVVKIGKLKLNYCEIPIETIYFDKFKGVTILDAFGILFSVIKWRFIN